MLGVNVCAHAATLYVATNGTYRDSTTPALKAQGRTIASNPSTPVRTITNAAQFSEPGDTIEVAPGTYPDAVIVAYVNNLLIRGKLNSPKPIIKPGASEDYSLVRITGSSFVTFTGFEVDGSNAGKKPGGILIVPRTTGTVITPCHPITVSYNKVHDAGIGSNPDGTYTVGNDYINITGNEVYNCLATGKYGVARSRYSMTKSSRERRPLLQQQPSVQEQHLHSYLREPNGRPGDSVRNRDRARLEHDVLLRPGLGRFVCEHGGG